MLKYCIVLIFLTNSLLAQLAAQVVDLNHRPQTVEERQKNKVRNYDESLVSKQKMNPVKKSGVVFTPNSYSLDERANKYYSQEEISKMTIKEKKEINFLLSNSFEVIKTQNFSCPLLDKNKLNVIDYSLYRKENERVELVIDKACNYRISLLSFDEITASNELITE